MSDQPSRRRKDSAKLVWDTKPKRAPNPRDIEFQTAEIVVPNPKQEQGSFDLPLLNLAGSNLPFNQVGTQDIDKSKMNRLIWGDNLLAMQALLAQGYAGKIDLIYIDPPFLSSADYNFQLSIEGKEITKEASILERLAYTDTWEGGLDSFLDMMYPRLQLMKRLLSNSGSIYIHIDWHISHYLKVILDEIFGYENFVNEIVWKRADSHSDSKEKFSIVLDTILFYSKSVSHTWNEQYNPLPQKTVDNWYKNVEPGTGRRYNLDNCSSPNPRPNMMYIYKGVKHPPNGWRYSLEKMEELDRQGRLHITKNSIKYKRYLDESKGVLMSNLWDDISQIRGYGVTSEGLGYPTQKPEALVERIIKASSNESNLVADFFCGSGTTMAVAERLGRRWIGCNLDKVGLQVSRNRMVEQGAKPFLMENIGNYQRHMIYLSGSKIGEMQRIMLKLYGADPRTDRTDLGVRRLENGTTELVYVGYPDRPVTARKVIELAQDAEILDGTGYKILVILAWDYDYNYSTEYESRIKALKQPLKAEVKALTIPPEIYNYLKKAKSEAELDGLRDKITFHEKPYVKISKPQVQDAGNGMVIISLTIDRYVLMNLPIPEKQQAELRKVIKDNFAALIDYWAVDWDYDGVTFRSTWQAIRGNGKRASTVITTAQSTELPSKKRTIAVRLVDVFGNDASIITTIWN